MFVSCAKLGKCDGKKIRKQTSEMSKTICRGLVNKLTNKAKNDPCFVEAELKTYSDFHLRQNSRAKLHPSVRTFIPG